MEKEKIKSALKEKCEAREDTSGKPKKTKKRLTIKEEIPLTYKNKSTQITQFQIINSKEEFENFLKNSENELNFNPKYTHQVYNNPNEELIGFKNLKIHIALTSKFLFPYIKVTYDDCLRLKDDINLLLKNHYETSYNTDEQAFLKKLEEEHQENNIKGKVIYHQYNESFSSELIIKAIDLNETDFINENMNLQSMLTFFIDGASSIPIENNFWNYFLIFEKKNNYYNLIGYCTSLHFHFDLDRYRSMISQFLILPKYQKKGYGLFLLENIYEYYINQEKCIEVTVEDPAPDFILLRDIMIFKKIVEKKYFDEFLKKLPINTLDQYHDIKLSKDIIALIARKIKIPKKFVVRTLELFKFVILNENNQVLYNAFKKEAIVRLYKCFIGDMDPSIHFGGRRKGPYISFHDEAENSLINISELCVGLNDANKIEKIELLYNELENDYKLIKDKCSRILKNLINIK